MQCIVDKRLPCTRGAAAWDVFGIYSGYAAHTSGMDSLQKTIDGNLSLKVVCPHR